MITGHKDNNMRDTLWKRILAISLTGFLLTGCSLQEPPFSEGSILKEQQTQEEPSDTGFRVMKPGEYDSADTAVVVRVSQDQQTVTLLNLVVNRNYTLEYDGTTTVTDQYGEALTMTQLKPGDMVDVTFRKLPKECVSIGLTPKAWVNNNVTDFEVNQARGQLRFNGEIYDLAKRMVITSGGEELELQDLNAKDVLSVQGVDNTVYSIRVEKGHGYLRLSGAEYFVGGWIEVGQEMVQRITEDMLLTVPEGTYRIVVRNDNHGGVKEASIHRDEETVLDVEDLKGEEIKSGHVFFTLTPPEASVYIDGEKVDPSSFITLEYGIHQMIVKATGYETITQYLKVGSENANLNVEMEPSASEEGETKEETEGDSMENIMNGLPLDPSENPTTATGTQTQPGGAAGSGTGETVVGTQTPMDNGTTSQLPAENGSTSQTPAENPAASQTTNASDGTYHVKVNAPANAEVYVDGNYVGIAPTSFVKVAGSHVISLRRTGYQTRSYTIQVDSEKKDVEISFSELVKKTDTTGEDQLWTNDTISKALYGS